MDENYKSIPGTPFVMIDNDEDEALLEGLVQETRITRNSFDLAERLLLVADDLASAVDDYDWRRVNDSRTKMIQAANEYRKLRNASKKAR